MEEERDAHLKRMSSEVKEKLKINLPLLEKSLFITKVDN
jgi:hypothetical protein